MWRLRSQMKSQTRRGSLLSGLQTVRPLIDPMWATTAGEALLRDAVFWDDRRLQDGMGGSILDAILGALGWWFQTTLVAVHPNSRLVSCVNFWCLPRRWNWLFLPKGHVGHHYHGDDWILEPLHSIPSGLRLWAGLAVGLLQICYSWFLIVETIFPPESLHQVSEEFVAFVVQPGGDCLVARPTPPWPVLLGTWPWCVVLHLALALSGAGWSGGFCPFVVSWRLR